VFDRLDTDLYRLAPVPIEQRHGLIWVQATPGAALDVAANLGAFADDWSHLELDKHVVFRSVEAHTQCNWKRVIEGFVGGSVLQRLYPEGLTPGQDPLITEHCPPHLRILVARPDLRERDPAGRDLRSHRARLYVLFPCTILLFRSTSVSIFTVSPAGVERCLWAHTLLVPAGEHTAAQVAHWEESASSLEGAASQRGDSTDAPWIRMFHAQVTAAVTDDPPVNK